MEPEGVRSAAMKGDSRTRALAMAGGRGRGVVMGPQNLEKKMCSRLCSREDEIKSYSQERRKLDKVQCENFKVNIHIELQLDGAPGEGRFQSQAVCRPHQQGKYELL